MKPLSQAAALLSVALLAPVAEGRGSLVSLGRLQAFGTAVSDNAEDQDPKRYPVTKVVTLLKDMSKQLESEAEADEEVYDSMMCWCKTNDREKTQAVSDAQARIQQLTTVVETTAADSARLGQEIENHEQDLAKSKESLDTATALREKQVAEFTEEEKDMLQSIKALDAAIVVLSKHHPDSGAALLDKSVMANALETVKYQMQRHSGLLVGAVTPKQRRLVLALGQQPAFRQTYQPGSGEIFGILRQMKETFETNLAETQKDESSNRKAYEELKAAKKAEITATQDAIDQKRSRKAAADEEGAQAKQEMEDLRASLDNDGQFLLDLKERCTTTEHEYASRVKMRQEEMQAVQEAIKILNDDQARDTFSKVMNPASFLQRRRASHQKRDARSKAASVLLSAKVADPKLVALATSVKLDPMTKVKEAIDNLVAELLEEKKLESAKRDSCVDRKHENEKLTETYQREHSDLEAKIDGLKTTVSDADEMLATLKKEIEQAQLEIKRKGEDRAAETKEFEATVADQREMQTLLNKALQVLKAVYARRATPTQPPAQDPFAFAQVRSRSAQEPPKGFDTYGKNRAAGGVLGLLEQIIDEAKRMEQEATREEQELQAEYERFVTDTNKSIASKQTQIVNQSAAKATAEQALITAQEDLAAKAKELETLGSTASAISMDCDFLIRNFDVRMEARDQEIDALREAKAVLSGMQSDE